ncbi:hypothetical protein GCM10009655_28780 [Rhodoglobus aureus]|uniref:Uncharacterized protein n=1 Tax=Rhodoglobus aureus TaxID=191497 RepID=A0ABP4GKX5_9MICO
MEIAITAAAESFYAFACLRSTLIDIFDVGRRPHERDRLNFRLIQKPIDCELVAVEHTKDPIRQSCLFPQLSHPDGCRRHFLTRLQHDCVADGDCNWKEPEWDHGWEIERADDTHNT